LEDVSHRVLAHAGRDSQSLVQKWADLVTGRATAPGVGEAARWRQTPVGLSARRWGRLVVPRATEKRAALAQSSARAGAALTLPPMADRDDQDPLLQAQSGLIRETSDSDGLDEHAALQRARSLGFSPAEGAELIPVVVRLDRG